MSFNICTLPYKAFVYIILQSYVGDCSQTFISLLLFFSDVSVGDVVTVGECRPLSKTVRFNVIKVAKSASSKKSFKKF